MPEVGGRFEVTPTYCEAVSKVLLTHAHADHYGSASELARLTGTELLGPAEEADIFAGRRPRGEPQLSEWERPIFERVMPLVEPPPPVVLDRELRPGDRLDWKIGAELIASPGHTSGHLAVWIPSHRTLIAGDAIATRGDERPIVLPNERPLSGPDLHAKQGV